jgi:hypothetical protein
MPIRTWRNVFGASPRTDFIYHYILIQTLPFRSSVRAPRNSLFVKGRRSSEVELSQRATKVSKHSEFEPALSRVRTGPEADTGDRGSSVQGEETSRREAHVRVQSR